MSNHELYAAISDSDKERGFAILYENNIDGQRLMELRAEGLIELGMNEMLAALLWSKVLKLNKEIDTSIIG